MRMLSCTSQRSVARAVVRVAYHSLPKVGKRHLTFSARRIKLLEPLPMVKIPNCPKRLQKPSGSFARLAREDSPYSPVGFWRRK